MRIVHAVSLVSTTGAFGGPFSVATGQLRALAARGHDVKLVSLWDGNGRAPSAVEGIKFSGSPARVFVPRTGLLGLFNFRYPGQLWRAFGESDVVHVHTGRDLASVAALAVAAVRRKTTFAQTHGMVSHRSSRSARAFDLVLRPLLRRTTACFVLTQDERQSLAAVLKSEQLSIVDLPNGVESVEHAGSSSCDGTTVIFLARMHERKRPTAFVAMAELVHASLPDVRFAMYGPDEGELSAVQADIQSRGLSGVVEYMGAISHESAIAVTSSAAVYVLPSVNEPFPMTILEALAVATPVVCTESTGISNELKRRNAASVTDGTPSGLALAVVNLLTNAIFRDQQVASGRLAVEQTFSIHAVAERLEDAYHHESVPTVD